MNGHPYTDIETHKHSGQNHTFTCVHFYRRLTNMTHLRRERIIFRGLRKIRDMHKACWPLVGVENVDRRKDETRSDRAVRYRVMSVISRKGQELSHRHGHFRFRSGTIVRMHRRHYNITYSSDASVMVRAVEAFIQCPPFPTLHHFRCIEKTFGRDSVYGAFLG